MPLAAGNCEVVNAPRKLSKRFKLGRVVYFVDLAKAIAVKNYLVPIGVKQANSNIFVGPCIDEVLKDADIRRVSRFDLEEQGISTGFRSDVTREDPGQIRDGAQVSSRREAAVLVVFGANERWRGAAAATLKAFNALNFG